MAVFDYEQQTGSTRSADGKRVDQLLAEMTLADPEIEERSIVDSGHDGYQKLRIAFPKDFVTEIGMSDDNDVIMKRVGDDGILIRVV